jgi:hypothetical protein
MLCKFVLLALTAAQNEATTAEPPTAVVPEKNKDVDAEPEMDGTEGPKPQSNDEIEKKAAEAPEEKPQAKVHNGKVSGGGGLIESKTQEDAIHTQDIVKADFQDEEENIDFDKIDPESNDSTVAPAPLVAPVTAVVNQEEADVTTDPNAKVETTGAAASTATLFVAALVSFAF